MARTLALASLFALTSLAGCIGSGEGPSLDLAEPGPWTPEGIAAALTQPLYEEFLREPGTVESFDGTRLYLEVYRPVVPDGVLVPVILVMTPYMTTEDLAASPYWPAVKDFFVPRGYAVAFADVRGTHNSGGCLPQTDRAQARDGVVVVEHLASQPWSTGRVGMYGVSYDAETQQSTATLAPPALVTIVPVASISNQYLWLFQNGVPYSLPWLGMTGYATTGLQPGPDPGALPSYPERVPCHVETHQNAMEPFHDGRMNAFWDERNWQPLVGNITASVFYVHGLLDPIVQPIHMLGWYNEIPSPKKAWIGQWPHALPTREDWTLALHRWFDHWLMGIDTGIMEEPPVQVQDSLGRWRNETAFPPASEPWTLFLRRDALSAANRLSPSPPVTAEPPHAYTDARRSPAALLPSGAGPTLASAPRLLFASEVLTRDVHVSGPAELALHVGASRGSTHLAVHLLDLAPDGTQRTVVRGYMDTNFRESLHEPRSLAADEVAELRFVTQPTDTVFRAGHRVALALMSDDGRIEQDRSESRVTIHHDAERPSSVTLPVVFPTAFHLAPEPPSGPA